MKNVNIKNMLSVDEKRNYFKDLCTKDLQRIHNIKEKIESGDRSERLIRKLNDVYRLLINHDSFVKFMRENNKEDLEHRAFIRNEYASLIDENIPSNIPIVFHGTNNIGIVREILRSGGLLTPEERNVSITSYAALIDVTSKTNIRTTLDFACPSENSYMPYGAIFAFLPQEDEYANILSTLDSSEVFGGVKGVNFRNEPERLIGVITTSENITCLKKWCLEYGIDDSKIYTHESFLEMCKNKNWQDLNMEKRSK